LKKAKFMEGFKSKVAVIALVAWSAVRAEALFAQFEPVLQE